METEQILAEIREANLSYLLLAQSLIRSDREQALYRLGINEESATMLTALTSAQIMKLARSNTLLCQFRIDEAVFKLLTSSSREASNENVLQLHAAILMAGRYQEAA